MVRASLPGDDIGHILLSSVENQLWAPHLDQLIQEAYYEPFCANLPEGMEPPFTVPDVVDTVKKMSLPNVMQGLATGSSQIPSLLQDPDPSAKERIRTLMMRMRENLAWCIPHLEQRTPPSSETIAEYLANMNINQA